MPALLPRALSGIAALRRRWLRHVVRRGRLGATRQLQALSDRTLKDIGVPRSEIHWAARHGRYRPRQHRPARAEPVSPRSAASLNAN